MDLLQELSKTKKLEYQLLEEIKEKYIKPHTRFYSEREILEKYELNRTTVRQALKSLTDKGLLYRINGKGTFIAPKAKLKQVLIVQDAKEDPLTVGSYAQIQANSGIRMAIQDEDLPYILIPIDKQEYINIIDEINLVYKNLSSIIFFLDISPLKITKDKLNSMNIPYLFLGSNLYLEDICKNYIVYDQKAIISMALEYLYDKGHRNIGFLYSSNADIRVQRLNEYRKWMKEKGLPINEEGVIDLQFDSDRIKEVKYIQIKEQLKPLLPVEGITAYFCADDYIALYLVNTATLLGYSIPDDFSIISINNYPFCQDALIPLTSVSIPFFEAGKDCVRVLDKMIHTAKDSRYVMPIEIFERLTVKEI